MDELQQDCEHVADETISRLMEREQFRLRDRLAEAIRRSDEPDPIRAKLQSLVQSAQHYLSITVAEQGATDASAALPLAIDLLSLRWELVDGQTTADLDDSAGALQVAVEQLAQKHGPMIRRTMTEPQVADLLQRRDERLTERLIALMGPLLAWGMQDDRRKLATPLCDVMEVLEDSCTHTSAVQVTEQIMAELRAETRAYKSLAKLRLKRLRSSIEAWWAQDHADDEQRQIMHIVVDLLLLCQHLGITGRPSVAKRDKTHLLFTIHGNLVHILDDMPVDAACHRQMRASIRRLMDRVQFWHQHPGDAYDGHNVADVLMPIITQLLEQEQGEVAR